MEHLLARLCLLLLLSSSVFSQHVFFGKTGGGKSHLINQACGLSIKVGDTEQVYSTTSTINSYVCLGTEVVDTVGLFDYRRDQSLTAADVIRLILHHVQGSGISSLLWVWPTWDQKGSNELESIFTTLNKLLPEIDMVIVENQWQVSGVVIKSRVPKHLSEMFKLPLISVSLDNVEALKAWIEKHQRKVQMVLPADWEDMIAKFDYDALRSQLLSATLANCQAVDNQLQAITQQITSLKAPSLQEQCMACHVDCTTHTKYCCKRSIFRSCVKYCTTPGTDSNCLSAKSNCLAACTQSVKDASTQVHELMESLRAHYSKVSEQNGNLLQTCNKLRKISVEVSASL